MKRITESPFADCFAELRITTKKMTFRKDEFDVYDYYYICEKTEREFTTNEATDLTLKQLYNQYREKHNILYPAQIKHLREQYKLSPARMSEVLGFGENIYRQYEKGEMPNKSNAKVLNLVRQPKNFIELSVDSELFSEFELNELKRIASELEKRNLNDTIKRLLRNYNDEIDQFTGYIFRSYKKFANMIVYFLKENERAFTTRLNKYMFYADFISYKYNGSSISGYTYCAIDKGPVLDNYKLLFSELWQEGYVETVDLKVGDKEIEHFIPTQEFDESLFTTMELDLIKFVSRELRYKKTEDIIEMSHDEIGWKDNIEGCKAISYQKYAPLLNF